MQFIPLALLAVGTGLQVRSQQNAGKAQEIQYKAQAEDEKTAARDREIERKRRLISSLSAQAAEAGAAGVDPTTGTRRAIALESVREKGYDSQTDSARTNRRSLLLRSAGGDARAMGNLNAAGTAINAGRTAYQDFKKSGGK